MEYENNNSNNNHNNLNMVDDDDDDTTLDASTLASVSLAISPDGTCPRHPNVILRASGDDGYVYQQDSCPACDADFKNQRKSLKQRKKELDRQLGQLDEVDDDDDDEDDGDDGKDDDDDDGKDDSDRQDKEKPMFQAMSDAGQDAVNQGGYSGYNAQQETALPVISSSQMPHPYFGLQTRRSQTDEEVQNASPAIPTHPTTMTNTAQPYLHRGYSYPAQAPPVPPQLPVHHHQSTVSLESLAHQLNMMQQMQDWVIRDKDIELANLRSKVDDLQHQLMHKQVEVAVLKEKMEYHERYKKQEIKLMKLAAMAAANTHQNNSNGTNKNSSSAMKNASSGNSSNHNKNKEIHIQELHVQVGSNMTDAHPRVIQAATQAATAAALETAVAQQQEQQLQREQKQQKQEQRELDDKRQQQQKKKALAGAPVPLTGSTAPTTTSWRPPSATASQPTPRTKSPLVPSKIATLTGPAESVGAPPLTPPLPVADSRELQESAVSSSSSPKEMGIENVEAPQDFTIPPPLKSESENANDIKESDDDESTEDAFDVASPPWKLSDAEGAHRVSSNSKTTPFVQATGPLMRQGPTNPNPNRKDPLEASLKYVVTREGPSSEAATAGNLTATGNLPSEFKLNLEAPSQVPLNEEITMSSLDPTSQRSLKVAPDASAAQTTSVRPHVLLNPQIPPKQFGHNDNDDRSLDNTSVGITIASSTYGEDRHKVVNRSLLDPYGDRGMYSGVVLRSTGMPHGLGRMVYEDDGRTFEGDWRHGRWHGYGRATFANRDSYEGEYRFDQRHGRGKYCWSDGRVYDGEFCEDKRHGKGTFEWPDGATYVGDFHQGQREGHGRYTFSDGGYYVGSWVNGRYEGFGGMLYGCFVRIRSGSALMQCFNFVSVCSVIMVAALYSISNHCPDSLSSCQHPC
jgi:hypothetical protein